MLLKSRGCKKAIFIGLLLSGCSGGETKSYSGYTKDQVLDLEIGAARNDLKSLRELQMHHDFMGNHKESDRIGKIRLSLNDPEELDSESLRLMIRARSDSNYKEKKAHLSEALKMARKAASLQGVPEKYISGYATVKLIEEEISELDTAKR